MFDMGLLTLTDIKNYERACRTLYPTSFSYSWSSCQSRLVITHL